MKPADRKKPLRETIARRVLVIEKEDAQRDRLHELSGLHGWEIQCARSINDARGFFSEEPTFLHYIDSDFHEDEIKAYVRELAARDDAHTVLAACADSSGEKVRALRNHGVYDCVEKRLGAEELLAVLERCHERATLTKMNTDREEEVASLQHAISAVIHSSKRIGAHGSLPDFCRALMTELSLLLDADGGSFFIAEENRLIRLFSLDPGHTPDEIRLPPREGSYLGLAYTTKEPVLLENVTHDQRAVPSGFAGYKHHSCLVLPVFHNGDDLIAFISLHDKKDAHFTQRDRTVGAALASVSAGMLRILMSFAALKENEARYRRFFMEGLTGNFFATGEGDVIIANEAFRTMLGIKPGSRAPLNFARQLGKKQEWSKLVRRLKKEQKIDELETEIVRADGVTRAVLGNLCAHFNAKHELCFISAAWFDITPTKELEQELTHSLKMEAIGRLAGGVAHDFNNLVTGIFGYCEVLKAHLTDSSAREEIEGIRRIGERAAALTRQLLIFTKKQKRDAIPVNVSDTVRELERMLVRIIGEDIELQTALKAPHARISADKDRIEQVIINLVVNARDALPTGGKIFISTEERTVTFPFKGFTGKSGRHVILSVRDTGVGMDQDTRRRIFEPFFSTKEEHKGTGLGLATVHAIVTQAHGFIDVKSAPGEGSTFRLFFPKSRKTKALPSPARTRPVDCTGTEDVIVVDDEKIVRQVIARILRQQGYGVCEAENGKEALRAIRAMKNPPALAVIDMVMPSMSGVELAAELQMIHPAVKVLFMSGYTDKEYKRYCAGKIRQEDIIQKPFHQDALARTVREILDRP